MEALRTQLDNLQWEVNRLGAENRRLRDGDPETSSRLDKEGDYNSLVAELRKRFTPVQLTAIQTQLFHSRRQEAKESVDDFAQDLRKLHSRAYSTATYANPEAEKVGQMVLANQFISGLRHELQAKVVGMEGTLDILVLRTRFEEAKAKELAAVRTYAPKKATPTPATEPAPTQKPRSEPSTPRPFTPPTGRTTATYTRDDTRRMGPRRCYKCGMEGHLAKACTYEASSRGEEARGRPGVNRVTTEENAAEKEEGLLRKSRIQELRQELHIAELEEALQDVSGVLKVLQSDTTGSTVGLGPTIFTSVAVDGVPAKALIDTGSPATIVSLKFILEVLTGQKSLDQSVQQWKEEVRRKFRTPDVSLKNYGGHHFDILGRIHVNLSRGGRQVRANVFVQKDAPNSLLLGTDVQPYLGFSLIVEGVDGNKEGLLFTERQTTPAKTGVEESPKDAAVESGLSAGESTTTVVKDKLLPNEPSDVAGDQAYGKNHLQPGTKPAQSTLLVPRKHQATQTSSGETSGAVGERWHQSTGKDREKESLSRPTGDVRRKTSNDDKDSKPIMQYKHQPKSPGRTPGPGGTAREKTVGSGTSVEQGGADLVGESSTEGVVCLLTATKVPAGHQKRIRGKIIHQLEEELLLFTPNLPDENVLLPDCVVERGADQFVTLVVENHGHTAVCLEQGKQLGRVTPVELVPMVEDRSGSETGAVHHITATSSQERLEELLDKLELDKWGVGLIERRQIQSLVAAYSDVFAMDASELGSTDLVTHSIDTEDHRPVRQPVRRTPFALRAKIDELVKGMLDQGVVEPSSSPWASPIVLVQKKDGGVRFCVDYRRVNSLTKVDEFPLPRIDDTLDLLTGQQYFTTLDLATGYWQVRMDPASKEKTAFTTYSGLYQFRKMPFGLVNAPATFQRLMEVVLAGLARTTCMVYLDDILVFGQDLAEHNTNLEMVLTRLREAGLRLKPAKCHLARQHVEFLGHIVSSAGVQTDPKKLKAVNRYPPPTDVKTLRSFLGLASYYRRFVPGFAATASPMHALTKKDVPFVWTGSCQSSFERIKELLTSAPVLVFPQFDRPFILETDASGAGLGAILAQKQDDGSVRPIAYASRTLQPHEKRYGATEMEGLGVVWAVKHFRPYLYGHACDLYTDHAALTSLLNTPQPSGKLARWGMAIQELDIRIRHRAGRSNTNADALSRAPIEESVSTMEEEAGGVIANISKEVESELTISQRQDDELLPIIQFLETGVLPPDGDVAKRVVMTVSQYTLEDSVLYHVETDGTLRLIPPTVQRETLFHQAHSGVFGAHLGGCKVFSELRRHYWWCSMRSDVTRWTRGCLVCTTREAGRSYRAPLTPIPVGGPFDRVGVDIIQFPQSRQGNRYAVVFMDYLTKWPEVFPVPDQTAATVARLLVEEIVSRHGVPAEVLSDRRRTFLSGLMREVEELLGFHKTNTSAYHPQTDGLVERFNRTLTAMLAKTVEKGGKDWDQRLPYVLFAYRASQQQSTQESPFFLLYGRDPRLPTDSALCPTKTRKSVELQEYGRGLVTKMSDAWELARKCIGRAQQRQKQYYDKRQRRPAFQVGDRTFLFKPAEKTGEARKFARPFHGPFRVVEIDVNTAKVRRLDRPQEEPILVAIDRLRRCPEEIADDYWPPDKKTKKGRKARAPQTRQTESVSTPTGSDNDPSNVTSDDQVMPSIEEDLQLPSGEPNDTHEELDTSPAETEEGGARAMAPQSAHEKEEMPQPGGRLSNGSGGKWAGRLRGRPQAKKLDEDAHCVKGG